MDYCIYCGEQIQESDEVCEKLHGIAHFECAEREDPEDID